MVWWKMQAKASYLAGDAANYLHFYSYEGPWHAGLFIVEENINAVLKKFLCILWCSVKKLKLDWYSDIYKLTNDYFYNWLFPSIKMEDSLQF